MTPADFSAWIRQAKNRNSKFRLVEENGSGHKRHFVSWNHRDFRRARLALLTFLSPVN